MKNIWNVNKVPSILLAIQPQTHTSTFAQTLLHLDKCNEILCCVYLNQ